MTPSPELASEDVAPAPAGGGVLGGLRAAIMLLTRFPAGTASLSTGARAWAAAWFPLVALALGALGAAVLRLAAPAAGGLLAAGLALGAVLLATGALHEDGLADTADALGGARPGDRERLFAILKDSRVGTYGALALGLSLLLRAAALARLGALAPAAFLLAQLVSRAPVVALMASLPYVTPAPLARNADVASARPAALGLALVATAAGVLGLVRLQWIPAPAAAVAAAVAVGAFLLCRQRFRARAGGITGDFLGACQQLTEVGVLVACVLACPASPPT